MEKITFLIGGLHGGGAERVTVALGNYFNKLGYDVNFISFSQGENIYDFNENIKLDFLPEKNSKISFFIRLNFLKKLLKDKSPDFVISLGLGHQYLCLGNLMKKYKFILSERNSPKDYYTHSYERFFNKYCFERAYKVVFQTTEAQEYYSKNIQNKSEIIFNPLTDNLPKPFKGSRQKKIAFVGRLAEQKNVYMLLNAFNLFNKKYPEYILELYGEGNQRKELELYVEKLNLKENIKFKGQVKNVQDKIIDSAMYISSSNYEGMSNSMIEAMAIGLPVICTDCPAGGARMVIDNNVNGILIPIKNEKALFKAMCKIVDNPDFANMLSTNSRILGHTLSSDKICQKWVDLINK